MDFDEESNNDDNVDEEIEDMLINGERNEEVVNEEYMTVNDGIIYENNEEMKILSNVKNEYVHLLERVKMKINETLNSKRLNDVVGRDNNIRSEVNNSSLFGKSFRKPYFILKNGDSFRPIICVNNQSNDELINRKWSEKEKVELKKSVLKHEQKYLLDNYMNGISNMNDGRMNSNDIEDIENKMKNLKEMKVESELLGHLNWNSICNDLENRNKSECYIYYHYNCDDNLNKEKWNEKEEILLMKLVEKYNGCNWLKISIELGRNRSAIECLKHYQRYLNRVLCKGEWSKSEDDMLMKYVSKYGENWLKISKMIEGRNPQLCSCRYRIIKNKCRKLGIWNKKDTIKLLCGMKIYGDQWIKISELFEDRSDIQCRQKWESLNPKMIREKWCEEEDELLLKLYKEEKGSWIKISKILVNRSSRQCKQRYKYLESKKLI